MNGKKCPACALQGEENFLRPFQISSKLAVVLCPQDECGYPFMSTHEMEYIERDISEITVSEENERSFNAMLNQVTQGLSTMKTRISFPSGGISSAPPINVPVPMEFLPGVATEQIPIIIEYLPEVPHESCAEFQNCDVLTAPQMTEVRHYEPMLISLANEQNFEIDPSVSAASSVYSSSKDFNFEQSMNPSFEAPSYNNNYSLMRGTGRGGGHVRGRRGRPRGSKNKRPPAERLPRGEHTEVFNVGGKKRRGRPRGSKSKRGLRGGIAHRYSMYGLESQSLWSPQTLNKPSSSYLQDYVTGTYMHQAPANLPQGFLDEELAKMDDSDACTLRFIC